MVKKIIYLNNGGYIEIIEAGYHTINDNNDIIFENNKTKIKIPICSISGISEKEAGEDAGNHNNSNHLCNIGDDLMDQQEEVKIELAKRLLANEAFMNQLMDLTQSLATAVMPVVNSIMNVMAQEIEESLSE